MGSDFQNEAARESYQQLGQSSAQEGYLDSLDGKIAELERQEAEAAQLEAQTQAAAMAEKSLLDEAELQIRSILGGVLNPEYGDDRKLEVIRDYLVKDLKLTDPEKMFEILRQYRTRPQKVNMVAIDRLYYSMMEERKKHDTSNLS